MAFNTTNIISEYDMLQEYSDIAKNYFIDVDPSKQRVGLFGYVTEGMAHTTTANLLDSMLRSREANVSTAQQMQTLLLAAAALKIDVPNAIPATIDTFLALPVSAVLGKGVKDGLDYKFTISKDTIVTVLGFQFLLDYDLIVTAKSIPTGYNYSAQYNISSDNSITDIANPYIITSLRVVEDISYVFMRVTLRQLTKNYAYYKVIQNDDINVIGIEFQYDEQLAYFNLWYKEQADSNYSLIPLHSILDKSRPDGRYLLYDTTESGIIKITAESAFRPQFNSDMRLDIYTTKGVNGSFTYSSGTTTVTMRSYEQQYDYSGITMLCIPIGNSVDGKDIIDMEELRTKIIVTRRTLNSLNTEDDLNVYFSSLDPVNKMTFVKKRSDIERRHSAYMIPRDSSGYSIPTATMNIEYGLNDFDVYYSQTNRRIIKANSKFALKSGQNYTLVKNSASLTSEQIHTMEGDITQLLFGTPYLIVVNENPESISYYLNSVSQQCTVKADFINNATINQFVINYFKIDRNAVLGDDAYTITVNVIPNSIVTDIVNTATGQILDANKLVVYMTIYSKNEIIGYLPLTMQGYDVNNNYFTFTGTMQTDDYLSLDNELKIVGSLRAPGASVSSDILIPGVDIRVGMCVYRYEDTPNGRSTYDTVIPNMTTHTLTNVYMNTDLINLFVDMSSLVRSTVSISAGPIYTLDEIPLVRYSYLQSNASAITNLIMSTKSKLDSMNDLVANNFSLDYKFYRTYGVSKYFKIGATDVSLDRLSLNLVFDIYLSYGNIESFNSNILTDMKIYIKSFIEGLNLSSGDGSLFISNLTTAIEQRYSDYIRAIELKTLNDYAEVPRVITYKPPVATEMTAAELREHVPEYLNIPIEQITINII